MQALYSLIYNVARSFKNRFGYAISIKQAILLAYFAFLLAVFAELTSLLSTVYKYIPTQWPTMGSAIVQFLPSALVLTTGTTLYIGILVFQKATSYAHDAWQSWINTTHM